MSRNQGIFIVLTMIIGLCSCVAAWLAIPQVQRVIELVVGGNTPTSAIFPATATPLSFTRISIEPTSTNPVPTMAPLTTAPTPTPITKPIPTSASSRTTLPPTSTPLQPFNFIEEFNSASLDKARWEAVGPSVEMKDGVRLKSNLAVFPYVYAKQNPFPAQGNFVLEIAFRYLGIAPRGAGLAADNKFPQLGANPFGAENAMLSFWQDSYYPLQISFQGIRVFFASGYDLSRHVIRLQYDGKYDVLVDNTLVYTSPKLTDRPSTIWFGNPINLGGSGEWTSLEIYYIRVNSTP